ncbi:MAG: asparagine synthetase B [Phycisphaerae bacterium]|nr:MAG: asparagine synthetase B [Phycisphaerae bacterium]
MCGITGYVGFNDEALLKRMCASIVHRGPDEDGFFTADGVGLAMRRLSIIDLASGKQPMTNEDGTIHVVFNGEIYNYESLTKQLNAAGHQFSTASDTETIVHLYEEYGLDFAAHLRGMFGIAIWDSKRSRLVLARDRIGEKPLYYAVDGDRFLFGSEPKTILQSNIRRAVNPQAVCQFLAAGYVPAPGSFYSGIQKLAPGEMLVWENGNFKLHRYWQRSQTERNDLSFAGACAELSERLDESVRLCLKSDVEVGAFLSGGLDSSVMVALMRKHEANVQTFAVGYEGLAAGFNELNYARKVADDLGAKHHELILGPVSSIELLPKILWHYDEPHGEPTSVLVYLLSQFTRKHVKVAVGGTGGDEIFYGYPRHGGVKMLQYYRWLPVWMRRSIIERIVNRWPESTQGSRFAKRAKRFVNGGTLPLPEAYLSWVSMLSADTRDGLVADAIKALADDPAGDAFLRDILSANDNRRFMQRVTDVDVNGYLPEYQLCYMDRMSMACGLEVRAPLCDFELVDFVTSLPAKYRIKGTRTKHIFKTVAAQWIDKDIAERKKVGFDSPIGQWFKGELQEFVTRFLSTEHVTRTGILNPQGVAQMVGDHLAGKRDYSLQLWSVIALEAWHRMYIEDGITEGSEYTIRDLRGGAAKVARSVPGTASALT